MKTAKDQQGKGLSTHDAIKLADEATDQKNVQLSSSINLSPDQELLSL